MLLLHEISPEVINRNLGRFFDSKLSTLREERGFNPDDWPGSRTIDRLVEISCGLFIWASIVCRFISAGKAHLAKLRIKTVIHGHRNDAGPGQQLDRIYITVLENATSGDHDTEEKGQLYAILKDVLITIVILHSALSISMLTILLHKTPVEVKASLDDLHTIFHILSMKSIQFGCIVRHFETFFLIVTDAAIPTSGLTREKLTGLWPKIASN